MTLHVPVGSAWWVSVAAEALLYLHIGGGAVGLISGAAALIARKGGRAHSIAGLTFVIAMTLMASIGAVVSLSRRLCIMIGFIEIYWRRDWDLRAKCSASRRSYLRNSPVR